MTRDQWRAFAIGFVLAVSICIGAMAWDDAADAADLAVWQGRLREAKAQVRVDSVQVVKWVTKTRTLRDTVLENLADTLRVKEYVYQTDTLRQRCLACTASAATLARTADTVILKVGANQRRWYDRVGVSGGYGVLLDRQGDVRHGVTAGLTVRLWP